MQGGGNYKRIPMYHTLLLDALLRFRSKHQISADEQQMSQD